MKRLIARTYWYLLRTRYESSADRGRYQSPGLGDGDGRFYAWCAAPTSLEEVAESQRNMVSLWKEMTIAMAAIGR